MSLQTTVLIWRMNTVNFLTTLYVKVREFHMGLGKGQTMTEYALILAASRGRCLCDL